MTRCVGCRGAGAPRAALGTLAGSAGWEPGVSTAGSTADKETHMQALITTAQTVLPGHKQDTNRDIPFPQELCPEPRAACSLG